MMLIRKITEIIDQPKRDLIYDILYHLNLDLCVDIGAAAGDITRKLCLVGGANTRIVAFEPFQGNHEYFYQSTKNLNNNISLIKKAVSDSIGTVEFIVPSVVLGTEPGWEKFVGYSSVGSLASVSKVNSPGSPPKNQKSLKSRIRGIFSAPPKRPRPLIFNIKTTTVDIEFPNEEIDFMKIDVQGAESKVLFGARTILQENRIHILYIEWAGDQEVMKILADSGYQIYDSTYIIIPKIHDPQPFEKIGFHYVEDVKLSTGNTAYEMILTNDNVSPDEAIREVKKSGLGYIQTDLIAISQNISEQFMLATKQFSEEQAKKRLKSDT